MSHSPHCAVLCQAGSKVINGIDVQASAPVVAAAEMDGAVRIYDGRADTLVRLVMHAHTLPASAVKWCPTNQFQV